ncbi:hypothetical protein F503_03517 [Ophiostoma piceae UAMH 11346]|uniref:Uncharacterized protein n=1 Tax=Ophiostoma piceae (strain UAMH 11346) TaxID=1262450 RepID=S3CUP6_OPHP1|nr:hypothetical protein F503_03517 [Ophiostoma piceae UAMH 11346]
MLLTSSQVSFAVSAGIVSLCTLALFLSGYVIQQRTLRQLRQSIREPRSTPPKIFLPDRFKKMTTELEDGSVITIDDQDEDGIIIAVNAPSRSQASPAVGGKADVEIVVKPSIPGAEDGVRPQQRLGESSEAEKIQQSGSAAPDPGPAAVKIAEKPVSKAERRRLIKEELLRLSHYDKPMHYQRRLY